MRGTIRKVSLARRVVIDLMHAAKGVPFVAVRRRLDIKRLAAARAAQPARPAWAALFAKAFGLLADEQPVLRTVYLKWPWPHFYEFDKTVAMVVIAPEPVTNGVLLFKLLAPERVSLAEADASIRSAKNSPIEATPFFRKTLRITRLPWPIRRAAWAFGLNIGRQRGNYFGSLLITSVAAFGGGEVEALGPGPFILSYGQVADDGRIDVMIRWDHRVTDAAVIGLALSRLEQILNGPVADELLASGIETTAPIELKRPAPVPGRIAGR
jgi:hypothetical protein